MISQHGKTSLQTIHLDKGGSYSTITFVVRTSFQVVKAGHVH